MAEGAPQLLTIAPGTTVSKYDKLYDLLSPEAFRIEFRKGRVRWSTDDTDNFKFYLRCNHEAMSLFFAPEGHPTDMPTRFILLAFSFCFGLMAEVVLGEIMGESTSGWVLGIFVGLWLSVCFMFIENCFTCDCIRKRMDKSSAGSLTNNQKADREIVFNICRCFGGAASCCVFAPGAMLCFFGAIAIMANQRDISYRESFWVTSWIWVWGWANAQIISAITLYAKFYYQITFVEKVYEPPSNV